MAFTSLRKMPCFAPRSRIEVSTRITLALRFLIEGSRAILRPWCTFSTLTRLTKNGCISS